MNHHRTARKEKSLTKHLLILFFSTQKQKVQNIRKGGFKNLIIVKERYKKMKN